jgi:putative aldouronate transport system permease protein
MVGIIMSFENYLPTQGIFGSEWVGLDNFTFLVSLPDTFHVLYNTVFIALLKIIANLLVPIVFALLLNELTNMYFKRTVQTLAYLPYFLSWVILGGILMDVLSPTDGMLNQALKALGMEPIFFLGDNRWFPFVLVIADSWKNYGFNAIIFLAAITGIDPTLYEASYTDGAGRLKQLWHITLPGMKAIIVLMSVLALGEILNALIGRLFGGFGDTEVQVNPAEQPLMFSDVIFTQTLEGFGADFGEITLRQGLGVAAHVFETLVAGGRGDEQRSGVRARN